MNYDYIFKIILVGESGVGKSSLLMKYIDNTFEETTQSTIGVDFKVKTLIIDEKVIKLQIWDTAGQERYHAILGSYFRGAEGIFIVYDIANKESFDKIPYWLDQIHLNTDDLKRGKRPIQYLIGNKDDKVDDREVAFNIAIKFAAEKNLMVAETSAKSGKHIEECFTKIATLIRNRRTRRITMLENQKNASTTYSGMTIVPDREPPSDCEC